MVFLYVPISQCTKPDFTKRFVDAFKVHDFCSVLGSYEDVSVETHKNTSLSGDRVVASFNSYPPKVYEIFSKSNSITVCPHKISVRMNNKVHCKTCGLIGHGTNACWTKDKSEAAKWVFSVSRQPANVNVTESNEDKEEVIPGSVPWSPSHTKPSASVAAASVPTGLNISESSDSLSVPSSSESTVTPSKSSSISLASKQATVPAPAVNKHISNVKSASTSRRNSSQLMNSIQSREELKRQGVKTFQS